MSGVCLAQPPASPSFAGTSGQLQAGAHHRSGAEYPRVTDDARVIFQFTAPNAQRVQAGIVATKYGMVHNAEVQGLAVGLAPHLGEPAWGRALSAEQPGRLTKRAAAVYFHL